MQPDVDADLAELALEVLGDHLLLFGQAGLEVEGQREAHAVLAGLVTRLVEQGTGLADIEGIGFHRLFIEGAGRDQGAGGRRGQAAVELVDDERAVDGVVDGLPDAHIGEFRPAEVEFEPVVRADALIALAGDGEMGLAFQPGDVAGVLHEREKLRLSLGHGHHAAGGVLDEPEDHSVERGAALDEEVRVLFEDDVFPGLHFHEPERPGADGGAVGGMGANVLPVAVDVLGDDGAQGRREAEEDGRVRLGEPDDGGVGIGRVHGFHRLEHGLEGVVGLDSHDGEGHVLGGDGLAVMKHGVGDEMEREALLVFGKGP